MATQNSLSLDEIIDRAVALCHGGMPEQVAAAHVIANSWPNADQAQWFILLTGVETKIQAALRCERRILFKRPRHGDIPARATSDRETKLGRKLAPLDAMYHGVDGTVKPLCQFSIADHAARLSNIIATKRGLTRMESFHLRAIEIMSSTQKATLSEVSASSRSELSELLTGTGCDR